VCVCFAGSGFFVGIAVAVVVTKAETMLVISGKSQLL